MHHSTFDPVKYPSHDKVARQLASDLLGYNSSLYSQHIPGNINFIADALSRDFHINDSTLIHMLRFCYDKQVPSHFAIYPVPKEIISWIESLRDPKMLSTELNKRPEPSNLEHLAAGKGFCPSFVQVWHQRPIFA